MAFALSITSNILNHRGGDKLFGIKVTFVFSDAARENLMLISHNVQDAYFNRGLGWKKKKKKGKKSKKKKKK